MIDTIIADEYYQWLNQPLTQALLKNLRVHRDTLITSISMNAAGSTDEQLRVLACSLKNTDAIISMTTNFEMFVKQLNKN